MDLIPTTVGGLPLHPLVVHFSVVLLPLAAFALIIAIFIPRFRKNYGFATLVGLFIGTGATVVAKQTGEALAAQIGLPQKHANYGSYLQTAAIILFFLSLIWYRVAKTKPSIKPNALGYLTAVISLLVLGLTFLTGHSGAEAVWKNKLPSTNQSSAMPSPSPSKTSATSKSSNVNSYTLAEVADPVTVMAFPALAAKPPETFINPKVKPEVKIATAAIIAIKRLRSTMKFDSLTPKSYRVYELPFVTKRFEMVQVLYPTPLRLLIQDLKLIFAEKKMFRYIA